MEQLLKLANEVYVFHSENISQTFHLKCYWLSGKDTCWYAIGSNNLTAGGLFGNYELSKATLFRGEEARKEEQMLSRIYTEYTDLGSPCCRKLDADFLEELLSGGYIVKEISQRKALVESAKQTRGISQKKLFGNEVFSAPALAEQSRRSKEKNTISPVARESVQTRFDTIGENDTTYLIRLVPRAGNRSRQVHFTVDLLKHYFCLAPGENFFVQEMLATGEVGEIEHRQVVFSQRNRNVKIELAGAAVLDEHYPTNPEKRPVLILKKVNTRLFVYMILLDGNDGYDPINDRLKSRPGGRSLPYEIINENTMLTLWSNCPIV